MNSYDLLGLIDTYNAMKRDKVQGTPATIAEFLTGIQPVDDGSDLQTPQLKQGNTTYEQGIQEVERRDKEARYVTNELGVGRSRIGSKQLGQFIPGDNMPSPNHQHVMDQKQRLDDRRELGYDK